MIKSGWYERYSGEEVKIEGIEDSNTDVWMTSNGSRGRYTNFSMFIAGGPNVFYTWLRPLEDEPEVPASEPVYVYVAYMQTRNNKKHSCSHDDEQHFNRMLSVYEQQGNTVLAKKRIKFNLN